MGEEEQRARLYMASRISRGRDMKVRCEVLNMGNLAMVWAGNVLASTSRAMIGIGIVSLLLLLWIIQSY